jgi:fatty-acyl-CoA synthase
VDGELYVVGRTSDMIIVGGEKLAPEEIEAAAERVPGVPPGRVVAFGVVDRRGGTEHVVLVCESAKPDDAEQRVAVERQLRRAVTQALGVTLGEVCFVDRGWIVKTSSGKKARGENREKYRREFAEGVAQ